VFVVRVVYRGVCTLGPATLVAGLGAPRAPTAPTAPTAGRPWAFGECVVYSTRPRMERTGPKPGLTLALLLAAGLFVNLYGLGDSPLARSEGLRALTGHQMARDGNYLVPKLYGKVYLRKPPLHYWTIAAAEQATGTTNEFVWRLPSALSAVGLIGLMWWVGLRWFGRTGAAVSGLATLGMVALWSQNRAAEIDALNTLASMLCAAALLEIGFGQTRRRWAWSIVAAAAFGATLLVKGPAGLPVIGGVMIGGSLATGRWRWLAGAWVWGALLVGGALLGAWAWAAHAALAADPSAVTDASGVNELAARLTPSVEKLLMAASMPFQLLGYAAPWSIAVVVALLPMLPQMTGRMDNAFRMRLRAAAGSAVAGVVICAVALIERPRYGYMVMPLMALVSGGIAEAWWRGWLSDGLRTIGRQAMTATVVAMAGIHGVLTYLAWTMGSAQRVELIAASVVMAAATIAALMWWLTVKPTRAMWGVAVMITALAVSFNAFKDIDRDERSGQRHAGPLREAIGDDVTLVVTEATAKDHPEVFWYAGVDARRFTGGLAEAIETHGSAWYVFDQHEWKELKGELEGRVRDVKRWEEPFPMVVGYVEGKGE